MISLTFSQLTTLISNSQLVVDETYKITDNPLQPEVKARTTSELWRDGTSSVGNGYRLLYDVDNTGPKYAWSSNTGYVYYVEDIVTGNSGWYYDLSFITNSTGVTITPYINNNQIDAPLVTISNSGNVSVDGDSTISISNCSSIIVGKGTDGTLSASKNVVVGDNSTVSVLASQNVEIGTGNSTINVNGCNSVRIGSGNSGIRVKSDNNVLGYGNRDSEVTGGSVILGNENLAVKVSGGMNEVSATKFAEVSSRYNTVAKSDGITVKTSVGNTIDDSRLVYIEDVNNNDIWATDYINSNENYILPDGVTERQYYPGESTAFTRVYNNSQNKVKKLVENTIPDDTMQTDNAALTVDTVNDKTKGSSKSGDTYYVGKDGLWNAEAASTDEWDVTVMISTSEAQHCYIYGAGRYANGSTCTLGYTWLDTGYTCTFVDENNNSHSAPYTFIVTHDTKITANVTI